VIAGLVALAAPACYSPDLARCTVRCTTGDVCPGEMSCAADRYCHPDGDTSTCAPDFFTVSARSAGTGTGNVAGGGLDCGPLCDTAVPAGTALKVTATADSGSRFTGWSGACAGAGLGPCTIKVDKDLTIGAGFNLAKPLSVTFVGAGGGQVVSDPAGIDCDADCTALYDLNTTVTLTATPDDQSSFAGWSDSCQGTGACVVSVTEDTPVTVDFE
jgi:hypothetical protein